MKKARINTDYDGKTIMELILKHIMELILKHIIHCCIILFQQTCHCHPFLIASSVFHRFAGFIVIGDALRDLVLFVQFKKREKHPWRSLAFS